MRDEPKEKNILIRSLITPYTLSIEHKEHKTKEFKNKSTIEDKNSINSKETSKTNDNMVSKSFPVTGSVDFRVNKVAPENDTWKSKKHVLLLFLYEDEDLLIHTAVSETTTATITNARVM